MRQRGEVQVVDRRRRAATSRFLTINNRTIMHNETEKNDSCTEPVASALTKRSWHAPEIEEVDFAETQLGSAGTNDLSGLS
jgi:hypothetical protein